MNDLTPQQLRYISRVISYNGYVALAADDIQSAVKIVQSKYGDYRSIMTFEAAGVQARTEWLREFLANPLLPREKLGTSIDLLYLLNNLRSDSGLLVRSDDGATIWPIKSIAPKDGGIEIIAVDGAIEADYPYVDHHPQDRKGNARKSQHELQVGWVTYRVLNLNEVQDSGAVWVSKPWGDKYQIRDVTQFNDRIALLELEPPTDGSR